MEIERNDLLINLNMAKTSGLSSISIATKDGQNKRLNGQGGQNLFQIVR